jgi:hypothetical protein
MDCPNGHPVGSEDRTCPACGYPVKGPHDGAEQAQAAAGWYPTGPGEQRYWDGAAWTEYSAPHYGNPVMTPQSSPSAPWKLFAIIGVAITVVIAVIVTLVIVLIVNTANDYSDNDCRHAASGALPGGQDPNSPVHDQWKKYVTDCKGGGSNIVV